MTDFITKDSGDRQVFDTGSRRDTRDGKGRYDLLPYHGIRRLAGLYERGAGKYGDRNWEKGQPLSRYADSMLRHGFQATAGDADEDHWAAVAWNALAVIDHQERIARGQLSAELDDLPRPEVQGQQPLFQENLRPPSLTDDITPVDWRRELGWDEFAYLKYAFDGATTLDELLERVHNFGAALMRQRMLGRDLSQPVDEGRVNITGFTPDEAEL